MEYIAATYFDSNSISGPLTITKNSPLETHEDYLWYEDKAICKVTSAMAHEYFARNDDGQGFKRWKLAHGIMQALGGFSPKPNEAWERVFDDDLTQKYKRPEHADYWLWNHDFFNAPIDDLEYIFKLVTDNDYDLESEEDIDNAIQEKKQKDRERDKLEQEEMEKKLKEQQEKMEQENKVEEENKVEKEENKVE